jgi:hypothetical protein
MFERKYINLQSRLPSFNCAQLQFAHPALLNILIGQILEDFSGLGKIAACSEPLVVPVSISIAIQIRPNLLGQRFHEKASIRNVNKVGILLCDWAFCIIDSVLDGFTLQNGRMVRDP